MPKGIDAAPHLSCVGATKQSIRDKLAQFRAAGIRRVVALRGDLPSGIGGSAGLGEFRYASDLVAFIRETQGERLAHRSRGLPRDTTRRQRYAAGDLQPSPPR